jgi:hypothetical protein
LFYEIYATKIASTQNLRAFSATLFHRTVKGSLTYLKRDGSTTQCAQSDIVSVAGSLTFSVQEDWVLAWKVEKPLIDKSKGKGTDVYYTLLVELGSHVDNCFRLTAGR